MSNEMSTPKSWLNVVGVMLGGIGILLCVAALIVLWLVSARLGRATDRLCGALDQSLVAVRQRVTETQDRVEQAKITAEDVEKTLGQWAGREAGQRVALRLGAQERVQRLADILQQADGWLDVAQSSAGMVKEVLSAGGLTTGPAATPTVDQLLEELASVRAQLAEATHAVANIGERIGADGEEKAVSQRVQQAARVAVRLAATLGLVDSRLEKFGDRISAAQNHLQELKARWQWWRQLASIGAALVILLMAAGQVALCRLAWNGIRESHDGAK
jgi:hypothetical protein